MQRYGQEPKNALPSALIIVIVAIILLVVLSTMLPFLLYFI